MRRSIRETVSPVSPLPAARAPREPGERSRAPGEGPGPGGSLWAMPSTSRLRHLTTVQGSFHGRLLAARLGAEGVVAQLRGLSDGPYPFQGEVDVLVSEEQLAVAREILLGDAVDAALEGSFSDEETGPSEAEQYPSPSPLAASAGSRSRQPGEYARDLSRRRTSRLPAWLALAVVVTLVAVVLAALVA